MFDGAGARIAWSLALGTLGAVAVSGDLHAQGLKVVGYGDVEWTLEQSEGDPDDPDDDEWDHFFDNHHFNLILVGWIINDLQVGGEVEYEHAGDEIALEYAYLAYTGIRNLRLVGGKFIIPFNRWNKDLHPTWISKVPGRPPVYSNVFPSTYSDVGLWVSGAAPVAEGTRITWDAYIVNGLKGDPDALSFRGLRDNPEDEGDDNKAVGGRLGLEFPQGLGIGGSAYTGKYAEDPDTEDNLNVTFLGADIDYHWRGLELRGEFVSGMQDLSDAFKATTGLGDATRTGFYAQASYILTETEGPLSSLEPVVRYSWVSFEEEELGEIDETLDTQELGIGFSYYIGASSAVRLAYFFNLENDVFGASGTESLDNDRLVGQFTVAF
jgi:hypothetical protein